MLYRDHEEVFSPYHPMLFDEKMVAHPELALTGRAPLSHVCSQEGRNADRSASEETPFRLLARCVAQHVAQYAFHVAPFSPHCVQKQFALMCQSLSFMSAQVLCVISHCTAVCSVLIQLPGKFPCIRREEMLFLSLPVVTSPIHEQVGKFA